MIFQGAEGSSSYETECSPEHFDIIFHQNRPKNEMLPPKSELDEGV